MNQRFIAGPGDGPITIDKRTGETLTLGFDWSRHIPETTISTSAWEVGDGLTQPTASSTSGYLTTVWLAGGQAGQVVTCINTITTADGRTFQRSFDVRVLEP